MAIPELRPKQASSRLRPIHVPTHERRRDQVTPPPIADSPVLTRRDVVVYFVFLTAWTTFNALFWQWWFQADHIVNGMTFILATIGLSYDLTLMPAALLIFLPLMKRPDPISPSPGLRVAMLTAIVPSAESIDILEQTVAGMTAVRYPHDNWVLDEGGDSRVRELCLRYGVNYWSRSGISEFNQASWPFQTKTKSGNYNAWFYQIGYERYSFIVQLDTDHVPKPGYLDEILGYFDDPDVAYVALPSVYRNLGDWTARGSSEQSQVFQGIMQMGYYGWARTPMIIGSHAAYRLAHLKQIGGFGPSRAEDHLDTLKLAQAGYHGVFVPKILAEGLGPHNLSDYLAQEHQWAFSIAQVLMKYGREKQFLDVRQRAIFLFSELWYSIYSTCYLLLFLLPLIALATNEPIVRVPFIEFMLYSIPVTIVSLSVLAWSYLRGWLRPGTHFFMSWQGIVLAVARWPIVLIAIANAIISLVFRQGRFNYLVTPKGNRALTTRGALKTVAPFLVLGSISVAAPILYARLARDTNGDAAGYVLFALMSTIFFILILIVAMIDFIRVNLKSGGRLINVVTKSMPLFGVACLLLIGTALSTSLNREKTETALLYWPKSTAPSTEVRSTTVVTPTVEAMASASPSHSLAGGEAFPPVSSWLFDPSRQGVTFGAYDPWGGLSLVSGLDHIFIAWANDATGGVPISAMLRSYERDRPVLLTIEPWPLDGRPTSSFLADIANGSYDSIILREASAIRAMQQPILVRFGHEMDMTELYPWSQGNPTAFVSAYRHVVDLYRANGATNVLWVWSPGGQLDAITYYPGDDYVDYVGASVLEYTRWETEIAHVVTPRPLTMLIQEKYDLLEPLGKPLILAEVGIALDPALKVETVREMIQTLTGFPDIRAVIYFNDRNPVNVMSPDQPQWALSSDDIDALWNVIARNSSIEQRERLSQYQITCADRLEPR